MALGEPGLVLEMQLIIGCLLCFVLLMLHCMLDQFSCMLIFVGVPVMAGVQELAPGGWSQPFGLNVLDGPHEAFGGSSSLCDWLLLC